MDIYSDIMKFSLSFLISFLSKRLGCPMLGVHTQKLGLAGNLMSTSHDDILYLKLTVNGVTENFEKRVCLAFNTLGLQMSLYSKQLQIFHVIQ